MMLLRAALAVALLHDPSAGADSARRVVIEAARAVEHDSADAARAMWTARRRGDARDRAALLGLSTLARLTYDTARADSYFDSLTAPGTPSDAFAAYGALVRAQSLVNRGLIAAAETAYASAVAVAHRAGTREAEAIAAIGLAGMRGRTIGTSEAIRQLDSLAHSLPDDPEVRATWKCERGLVAAHVGERTARSLAEAGIALARRAGDTRLEARCESVVAQDYLREGDMPAGASVLRRVEAMLDRVRERSGLAATLQWHGYLEVSLAHYGTARGLLDRAVRESERSGNVSALAWALVNLSEISIDLDELPLADREAARAESTFRAVRDSWGMATALGMRGQVALEAGDTTHARTLFTELLAWGVREHRPQSVASSQVGLADIAVRARDWAAAKQHLDAARDAYRRGGGSDWAAGLSYYYGVLALHRGDLSSASRALHDEIATLGTSQHARRYIARATLAEIALRRGDTTGAERELRDATEELDAWRSTLDDRALRLAAFQVRDPFGGRPPAIAAIIAAVARSGRVTAAFQLAERRRARVLRDQLVRAAALRSASDAPVPAASPASISVDDARLAVPDEHTAVLEYVTGPAGQPTTLFLLTRSAVHAVQLAPIDSLRGSIASFAALLEGGAEPRALARRLGTALLAPASMLPPSVSRLVIVPDGDLWHVPFQALIAPDGRYVIERWAVATAPSVAVLVAMWREKPPPATGRMLAFGDPRFGDDEDAGGVVAASLRAAPRAETLPRLPATAREVRAIARFAADPVIRLRGDASAAYLERTPLSSFRVIHFATHAIVEGGDASQAGLVLSPGNGFDGFVSAGDLAALHLDADLVVLSACRTAGGVVLGGEGVRGLTAPLIQAGARSVVATEWPVSDDRIVSTVVSFYDALARGLPVADALRDASERERLAGAPPRDWAAFRLVGDPLVRVPLREPHGLLGWRWWR